MESIVDEAGMCVVNTESVQKRLSCMSPEEIQHANSVSTAFLSRLITLVNCSNSEYVKDTVNDMVRLLLNDIYSTEAVSTKFVTFSVTPEVPATASSGLEISSTNDQSIKFGEAIFSILGGLDPLAILSHMLDDGSGDPLSGGVAGLLSVLRGFNPVKIHDLVVIEKCQKPECKACHALKEALGNVDPVRGTVEDPFVALLFFFRCMNHKRLDFEGDIEGARASRVYQRNSGNPNMVEVNLRELLLSCVDVMGGDGIGRALVNTLRGTPESDMERLFSDSNEEWRTAVRGRVASMPLASRAVMTQVYCFLILSRYTVKSGDCMKQFLYTIFARFLYAASEVMFCQNSGASREVDGGRFLQYVDAMTKATVMSGSLVVEKVYRNWRTEDVSVTPILNMVSGKWREHLNDPTRIQIIDSILKTRIDDMARLSAFSTPSKNSPAAVSSGLDSVRSVRQAEKYIPFGFASTCRAGLHVLSNGISMQARMRSNGKNFHCNSFHILPSIKYAQPLGTKNLGHQSCFEQAISPRDVDNGTGRILGFITAFIDKQFVSPIPKTNDEFDKRVANIVKELIFTKKLISEDLVSSGAVLPSAKFWQNPVLPINQASTRANFVDSRIHTLFLLWQKPCIEATNVSSLTVSQLELLMSRDPAWAELISRVFYIIERISFQLADSMIKTASDGGDSSGDADAATVGSLLTNVLKFNDAKKAQQLIDHSLHNVEKEWTTAVSMDESTDEGPCLDGVKAQYSLNIYNLLRKIVIESDWDPATICHYSNFLSNLVNTMDDMLMRSINNSCPSSMSAAAFTNPKTNAASQQQQQQQMQYDEMEM